MVARTMDWPESTEPVLTVLPRGMRRDGGRQGTVEAVKDHPLNWTSIYGSLATTIYYGRGEIAPPRFKPSLTSGGGFGSLNVPSARPIPKGWPVRGEVAEWSIATVC